MEYYTIEEIKRKTQAFERENRVDQIYKHRKKGAELYTFYQSYENKEDSVIDIDQIMLDNGLKPKCEIIPRQQSSYYNVDILYKTLFRIKTVNHRAKIKRGLVDDWIEESSHIHFFDYNFKLVELNTLTTKWLTARNDLAKKTLWLLQRFLFDAEYRDVFKKFILNPQVEYLEFNTKKNRFTLYTGLNITIIAEEEVLISFKEGFDFKVGKIRQQIPELKLIKRPIENK
jgi:hypothetical protein